MANCPTSKRAYSSEALALDALIEARTNFVHNTAIAVYQCEDCGDWHLTSQGAISPRLKEMLDDGSLKKQQESINWERKFRRK